MKDVSFQPKLVSKVHVYRDPNVMPEDVLWQSLYDKQEKLERLRREKEESFLEENNNFMPRINKRSKSIDKIKVKKIKKELEDGNENIDGGSSEENDEHVSHAKFNRFDALYI